MPSNNVTITLQTTGSVTTIDDCRTVGQVLAKHMVGTDPDNLTIKVNGDPATPETVLREEDFLTMVQSKVTSGSIALA